MILNNENMNRGHWYSWQREFYFLEFKDGDQETNNEIKIISLNIFQRITRILFGAYQYTHLSSLRRQCDRSRELIINQETNLKIEAITQRFFPDLYNQLLATKNDSILYEEITSPDNHFACIKSTTYHPKDVRKKPNPGHLFCSDHAAFTQLEDNSFGTVCDGLGHLHGASGAAYQVSRFAISLAKKYKINFDDSFEEEKKKLKQLAYECRNMNLDRQVNWEVYEDPTSALIYYQIIKDPNNKAKRRLVGFNIGDGSLFVFNSKSNTIRLISEPQQNPIRNDTGAFAWNPAYIPSTKKQGEKGVAQDSDIRIFSLDLQEDDYVIAATDGLLDGIDFDKSKELLDKLNAEKRNYYETESPDSLLKVREVEREIFEAKTNELNKMLQEKSNSNSKIEIVNSKAEIVIDLHFKPIELARKLFEYVDNTFNIPKTKDGETLRGLEAYRDNLQQIRDEINTKRTNHLNEVGEKYKSEHPQADISLITKAKDEDIEGKKLLAERDQIDNKIGNANLQLISFAHLERDDTTIQIAY